MSTIQQGMIITWTEPKDSFPPFSGHPLFIPLLTSRELFANGSDNRYLHVVISVLRIAFSACSKRIGDSQECRASAMALLSPESISSHAELFNQESISAIDYHSLASIRHSDTVYLAATDADGNGCSFVNSLADRFGSMIIPAKTGLVLHCRGSWFKLDPKHPNSIQPGRRPYNTIIPALITSAGGDALEMVFGVMGGLMQPQGHLQVLLNMLMFGMDEQVALDAPRVCISTESGNRLDLLEEKTALVVNLEQGIDVNVASNLEAMGYQIATTDGQNRSLFGRGQVIRVIHRDEQSRTYAAGSDMRGDGLAAPM